MPTRGLSIDLFPGFHPEQELKVILLSKLTATGRNNKIRTSYAKVQEDTMYQKQSNSLLTGKKIKRI